MLRTNNKKFIAKLENFVIENTLNEKEEVCKTLEEAQEVLFNEFNSWVSYYEIKANKGLYNAIVYWSKGLPNSSFDFIVRGNKARVFLKEALEETEEEANKFELYQADEKLLNLIVDKILYFYFMDNLKKTNKDLWQKLYWGF